MARVTHFDISAEKPEKLIPFYEKIFNWKFDKWAGDEMDYWMITTGPEDEQGINGGLAKREKDNYVVNTIEVKNIDKAIKQIKDLGGKILMDKSPIPGVGWYANFEDPEHNILGLLQPDADAK